MVNYKTVKQAKDFLEENGYYVGNLWSVEDVQRFYKCTKEEAYEVLDEALQTDSTFDTIWDQINYCAKLKNLEEK